MIPVINKEISTAVKVVSDLQVFIYTQIKSERVLNDIERYELVLGSYFDVFKELTIECISNHLIHLTYADISYGDITFLYVFTGEFESTYTI